MTARQLGIMALERLPEDPAQVLKRASAWPACAEDNNLDAALVIAHSTREIRVRQPVSKKQQRLQNAAVSDALHAPDKPLEVSSAWRIP